MKNHFIALIGIALIGFSSTGGAVIYDFAAQGNAVEAGYSLFDTGTNPDSILAPGIQISASNGGALANVAYGSAPTSTENYFAYFDGSFNQDGGLGVCKRTGGNCAGNPDDNQMPGEYIHMDFTSEVILESLSITGDHVPVIDNAVFWYSFDEGASWNSINFGINNPLIEVLVFGVATSTLDYTIQDTVVGDGKTAYMYLSAMTLNPVPVPAAFWLFGTALFGFITMSRRIRV